MNIKKIYSRLLSAIYNRILCDKITNNKIDLINNMKVLTYLINGYKIF